MKNLNFGCRRSDFLVTNSNDDWFIQCRFYEPDRNKPFTYRRRLNKFKNEVERKKIEKSLLKDMVSLIDEKDYNPRTKEFMFESEDLNPYLSLSDALIKALERKEFTPEHRINVLADVNNFNNILEKLNLNFIKIKDVELLTVKKVLESLNMTNYKFNKAKIHLSSLFTDLVDMGCLKVNPCTGIKSKQHIVQKKEILTDDELFKIDNHIKNNYSHFYNFYKIFYMSGCRIPELLGLKKTDVDLERAEFTILLKKGQLYVREKRAIIFDALPFWRKQLENALFDDDFVFSFFYHPGPDEMHRALVYKFWTKKISQPLNINKGIYFLKHTFLDKLDEAHYNAQIMAGHRDGRTTDIYTVGKERRRLEYQKQIRIS